MMNSRKLSRCTIYVFILLLIIFCSVSAYEVYAETDELMQPEIALSSQAIGKITIKCSEIEGAEGFSVEYSKSSSFSSPKTLSVSGSALNRTIGGIEGSATYYVRARAYAETEEGRSYSAYSETGSVKVKNITAPSVKVKNHASFVKVSWSRVSSADGYKVYRKAGSGDYKLKRTVAAGGNRRFIDENCEAGKKYTYKIKEYTDSGAGNYRTRAIMRLSVPKAKAARSGSYVKISWNRIKGAEGYEIYKKYRFRYTKVATVKSPEVLSKKIKDKYYYRHAYAVRAVNGSSKSEMKDCYVSSKHKHKFVKTATHSAKSCTDQGYVKKKCRGCGLVTIEYRDDPKPHRWSGWTLVSKDKRTSTKYKVRTCSVCGAHAYRPENTGNPVVDEAIRHVGEKYRAFPGSTYTKTPKSYQNHRGVDCSHFVYFVLKDSIGYDVKKHKARDGKKEPYDIPKSGRWAQYGKQVTKANAKAGDIICLDGHVMIYMGEGKVIHSINQNRYPYGGIVISDFGDDIYDVLEYYKRTGVRPLKGIVRFS